VLTTEEEEEDISAMDVKTKGKGKATQVDTQGEDKTPRRVNSIAIRHDPSISLPHPDHLLPNALTSQLSNSNSNSKP
jgi:hypothetical protein